MLIAKKGRRHVAAALPRHAALRCGSRPPSGAMSGLGPVAAAVSPPASARFSEVASPADRASSRSAGTVATPPRPVSAGDELGRASCWARAFQYQYIAVGAPP